MMHNIRNGLSIVGLVRDEVIGPIMVGTLRPQPNARPVIEPEPPAFGLFARTVVGRPERGQFSIMVIMRLHTLDV
jgi:hypothetical protein